MFCPQCGASNADTAAVCVQCGRNLQPVSPAPIPVQGVVMPPGTPAASVPNYLVFAILTTVLCCLFTGIPAIIYAAQVNDKLQKGDVAGAQAASSNAKMWCWISFGLGLAAMGASIVFFLIGALASMHQH